MKLYFNHEIGFGKMQRESFLYVPFAAVFELHEKQTALENGWIPINNSMWFQCRSTRINLEKYYADKKIIKLSKKIKYFPHLTLTEEKKIILAKIYDKYITKKGFDPVNSLTIEDMINNSHGCIYYMYENSIIAFSFYKIISNNYLSIEFAWDYENPKLCMGHVSVYLEHIFAKNHRCKYMYLSAGYERCSVYKADYPGFEWWKGYEWSDDKDAYKNLCIADEKVEIRNFKYM